MPPISSNASVADSQVQFSTPKHSRKTSKAHSPAQLSPGTSLTSPRKRRPGSGRFYPSELSCFKRVPVPSQNCKEKAEVYWQSTVGMRRVFSDSGLHTLPATKGDFWKSSKDDMSPSEESLSSPIVPEKHQALPLEDMTSFVLEQIYPRNGPSSWQSDKRDDGEKVSPMKLTSRSKKTGFATSHGSLNTSVTSHLDVKNPDTGSNRRGARARLLSFRQQILEKFTTMKNAFDAFAADNSGSQTKELSRKEFHRFLSKHFAVLPREDYDRVFEFLDTNKNGMISLSEFHSKIEAASPVYSMEDLRRKWIALGFTSMKQVFNIMAENVKDSNKRMNLREFGALLTRVGVQDEDEHESLFTSISDQRDPNGPSVSMDELTSAIAAVSPALVLEDLRDKLLKRYGSLNVAYAAIDIDSSVSIDIKEFLRGCTKEWKLTVHEALKSFRLIDIDGSHIISKNEFVTALRLSEPSLFLEEVRRKVRQRFRCIHKSLRAEDDSAILNLCNDGYVPGAHSSAEFSSQPTKPSAKQSLSRRATYISANAHCIKQAFEHGANEYQERASLTPSELQGVLASVLLTDSDTQLLFELMDINRDGKLTSFEFSRGIRLFAPSCALEDLRLRCLRRHPRIADVFKTSNEVDLDVDGLNRFLQEHDLGTGINAQAVLDIAEPFRGEGSIRVGELVAALVSAAPGTQVHLAPDQRDSRARQQVKGQMAPFLRSVSELRSNLRQKPHPDSEDSARSLSQIRKHGRDSNASVMANTEMADIAHAPKTLQTIGSGILSRYDAVAHPTMKNSYSTVTNLLLGIPSPDANRILDKLHGYYVHGGSTLAHDAPLLSASQSQYELFRNSCRHRAVLARPVV